jgi:hypothetical protein
MEPMRRQRQQFTVPHHVRHIRTAGHEQGICLTMEVTPRAVGDKAEP